MNFVEQAKCRTVQITLSCCANLNIHRQRNLSAPNQRRDCTLMASDSDISNAPAPTHSSCRLDTCLNFLTVKTLV